MKSERNVVSQHLRYKTTIVLCSWQLTQSSFIEELSQVIGITPDHLFGDHEGDQQSLNSWLANAGL
jgi:hypothetical protein